MAVWLVTGATGFVGRHVLDALEKGDTSLVPSETRVIVLGRRCPEQWPRDDFAEVDLTDTEKLPGVINRIAPDYVIHTAGRTPPAPDEELYRANFWATIHLLSALRTTRKPARVVLSGSAAELGPVEAEHLPVRETFTGFPRDTYGKSKWLATSAGLAERSTLEVMVARVFNPIGPGTPPTQAFGRFADRLTDPDPDPLTLVVGDLEARRDFIDVRDVARAMVALALRGHAGLAYNVGTGRSRGVGEGLQRLIGLSGRAVHVSVDPALQSRRGPADSRADIDRILTHTDWRPSISWDQSIDDLWREVDTRKRPRRMDQVAAA
jgi:GDP-4-dehydro-6-deoxy-D-mannose reductase